MVVWSICSELQKRESANIYKGSLPITPIQLKKMSKARKVRKKDVT